MKYAFFFIACVVCFCAIAKAADIDVAKNETIHGKRNIECVLGGDDGCSLRCGFHGGCCGHNHACLHVCYCHGSGYDHRCHHCDI